MEGRKGLTMLRTILAAALAALILSACATAPTAPPPMPAPPPAPQAQQPQAERVARFPLNVPHFEEGFDGCADEQSAVLLLASAVTGRADQVAALFEAGRCANAKRLHVTYTRQVRRFDVNGHVLTVYEGTVAGEGTQRIRVFVPMVGFLHEGAPV